MSQPGSHTPSDSDSGETQPQNEHLDSDRKEKQPVEIGGRKGPEPTRFGDWEKDGRCIDF